MESLKSSLRKFYGRYGDLIRHYEVSLSQMLHDILGHDHVKWHPQLHQFANLLLNWTLLPILTLLPNFGGFHRTLQRVRLANRGRLLLRTPGPVPFGICICSSVETILSWTCHVYSPFMFRISIGTFILLLKQSRLCFNSPVRARGVKSRMCPPYPQRDRKRRQNGAVCRNHRIKRVVPCRC